MRRREESKKRSYKWFYILIIAGFVGWIMLDDYGSKNFEKETIEIPMP